MDPRMYCHFWLQVHKDLGLKVQGYQQASNIFCLGKALTTVVAAPQSESKHCVDRLQIHSTVSQHANVLAISLQVLQHAWEWEQECPSIRNVMSAETWDRIALAQEMFLQKQLGS